MQTCHCLRRILFSVLLLCPASAGLPLLSVAQESYRTQMSFRKPFLTPSTASKETPSARPGHAKPFMGWRKAAQDGPATLQYFKELANSRHAKSLRASIWSSLEHQASVLNAGEPYASTPPAFYPGIFLRPSLPAGALPSGIATGDFNGDGKLDWVIANAGDNSLCLYLGNGDGTAQLPVIIPLLGQSPLSVAAGDLNGDHKLDLVVAETDSKTVGILYGNGDGTFQPEIQIVMPVQPLGVALADANNDGYLDLFVGTLSDGVAVSSFFGVMLNDGKGNFAAPVYAPNPTPGSLVLGNTFAFADANADGKLDVLVSGAINLAGTTLQLFFGNGNGTFTAGPQIWASTNAPLFESDVGMAAFADLNGDGCPDISVAMSGGLVNVLFNDCKGNFPQSRRRRGLCARGGRCEWRWISRYHHWGFVVQSWACWLLGRGCRHGAFERWNGKIWACSRFSRRPEPCRACGCQPEDWKLAVHYNCQSGCRFVQHLCKRRYR